MTRIITLQQTVKVATHSMLWGVFIFVIAVSNLEFGFFASSKNTWAIPSIYGNLFNIILFYVNVDWLMPRYYTTRKVYMKQIAWFVVGLTAIETLIDLAVATHYHNSVYDVVKIAPIPLPDTVVWGVLTFEIFLFSNLPIHLIFLIFSIAYRFYIDRILHEKEKQELQNQKLTAELNYLKAQLNPHFLFNGMNSLYHLMDEDVEKAKHFLVQFSNLLRYQLYECEVQQILLEKEIAYLEDYISLQSLRKGADAEITYQVEFDKASYPIAPLLLIPFIENAFKYLSSYAEPSRNQLSIAVAVEAGKLDMHVSNTYQALLTMESSGRTGGLGLLNVKKRLELLYPNKYELHIQDANEVYQVHLKLMLR